MCGGDIFNRRCRERVPFGRTKLSAGETACSGGIVRDDTPRGFFVRCFKDCDPCIGRAASGTGQHQNTILEQCSQPFEVAVPSGLRLPCGNWCDNFRTADATI